MEEGVFVGWLKTRRRRRRAPARRCSRSKATRRPRTSNASTPASCASRRTGPRQGDTVAVGAVIGYLVQPGEAASPSPARQRCRSAAAAEVAAPQPVVRPPSLDAAAAHRPASLAARPPRRRRAGRRLDDAATAAASTGRIRERDVRAAAADGGSAGAVPLSRRAAPSPSACWPASASTAPVTLTTTVDATNLVNLRQQFKAAAGDDVPELSPTSSSS